MSEKEKVTGAYELTGTPSMRVWQVRSRTKLPSAECLAVHLFNPTKNTNKPAKVKWGRKCPICRRHDELKGDLDSLLRLKA
jgi:ribosomal protein L33